MMDKPVPNEDLLEVCSLKSTKTSLSLKINKAPTIKKARLSSKLIDKIYENKDNSDNLIKKPKRKPPIPKEITVVPKPKLWDETKIFVLPLMPSDAEERYLGMDKEYRCSYCDELCDQENLECKVCSKVSHTSCLCKRGYLDKPNVSLKNEWTCSDCSDLSKLLTDEEMQKIISVFERLDFRKDCFVKFNDYLEVKRKLYEEDGDTKMTSELELEEFRRFKLIDISNSGAITWNDFVEFETADLLAKKNKVELSSHLSKKELISAKRKFLSYDKHKMKMITKEDAKLCYLEYFRKLKEKLGHPFLEHISNCIDLYGFKEATDQNKGTAKTMWPEFIRKLTILLLYDRLNSSFYQPQSWKPGTWFQSYGSDSFTTPSDNSNRNKLKQTINHTRFNPNIARLSTAKRNLLPDENLKQKTETNSLFDVSQIMSQNMSLDSYKPHENSDFGSYQYKIRSKKNQKIIKEEILNSEDEDENNKFPKFDSSLKLKIKHKRADLKEVPINVEDWLEKNDPLENDSKKTFVTNVEKEMNQKAQLNMNFEYSKVTDDIYKSFGRIRRAFNYPQQITVLGKVKTNKTTQENTLKNFYIPDLIENIKYSKHYFASDNSNSSDSTANSNKSTETPYAKRYTRNMHLINRHTSSNNISALTKIQIDPLY